MEYAATLAPSSFLQRVFAWMFAGLLVTAAAAAAIGTSDALLTDITANPILLIVLFVAAADIRPGRRRKSGTCAFRG